MADSTGSFRRLPVGRRECRGDALPELSSRAQPAPYHDTGTRDPEFLKIGTAMVPFLFIEGNCYTICDEFQVVIPVRHGRRNPFQIKNYKFKIIQI